MRKPRSDVPGLPQRLGAELLGTFAITLAAVCVDVGYFGGHGTDFASRWLTRAFVTAAAIFTFSELSGAHFSPAVTFGFALRGVFGWRAGLAYVAAQFAGAAAACSVAYVAFGSAIALGASRPGPGVAPVVAAAFEVVLTFVVMLTILLTAENKPAVGKNAALAVGFAVGACGFFAGPISGASMNPARSIVPQLFAGRFDLVWIYAAGPLVGAALAVAAAAFFNGAPSERERHAATGRTRV